MSLSDRASSPESFRPRQHDISLADHLASLDQGPFTVETLSNLKRLYKQDFVAWCEATIARPKAGRLDDLDVENLVEEIESLGKRDRREVKNHLTVLLSHRLKLTHLGGHDVV